MAVLKEKDINATLTILRQELMNKHDELEKRSKISASRNERIMKQFRETYHLSNQNSLMLYSQRPEYVFDLTYACHEATKQFQEFTRHSLPLKRFIEKNDAEIARYDSLIGSLEKMMRFAQMDEKARIDCNVCLTMATNIRNSMKGNREDLNDYERLYKQTGRDSERGTGARGMRSALEDVYEALVGALYLDGGYEAAHDFVARTLHPLISPELGQRVVSAKSRLQEHIQRDYHEGPVYKLEGETGPAHSPTFTSVVLVEGRRVGRGSGSTKKESQAAAAADALQRLGYEKASEGPEGSSPCI